MEYNQNLMELALKLALMETLGERGTAVQSPRVSTSSERANQDGSESMSSLEQVFHAQENVESYTKAGKLEEAHSLLKKAYKRGPEVHFAQVLVNYYVSLMKTNRPEKAVKIRDELISVLQDKIDICAKDAERYGNKLRNDGDLFAAILFFQVSLKLCDSENDANEVINALHRCAAGTAAVVSDLMEKKQTSRQLVKSYIIPYMEKIVARIGRYQFANKREVGFVQGVCLHYVEQCQFAAGDLEARETSLNRAIATLRESLGKDAEKRHIFGGCLNNLGHTYLLQGKSSDAARLFTQAISAKQRATDYDTQAEKLQDVRKSEMALSMARQQQH